jgi:hypothetical protein
MFSPFNWFNWFRGRGLTKEIDEILERDRKREADLLRREQEDDRDWEAKKIEIDEILKSLPRRRPKPPVDDDDDDDVAYIPVAPK